MAATCVFTALGCLCVGSCQQNPQQYLASGERYFDRGKYQEAVIQFRNSIQENPRLSESHYHLALTYLRLNRLQEAYPQFEQTVALDPSNLDAELQLAELQIVSKKYDDAKATAAKVLAIDSRNARAHAILGRQYAFRHDWQNATRELQSAIVLAPGEVKNYSDLTAIYTAMGHDAEAEDVSRKAVEVNPQSAEAHENLGKFEYSQHQLSAAEEEMQAASKLEPSATLPLLLLAGYYQLDGKFADAEKVCVELKRIAPDDPQAYRALAFFYLSTGTREKAASEFRAVLTSKPKDSLAKSYLAQTLLDLNRTNEAGVLTREILQATPGDAQGLLLNGRILLTEGKYNEAARQLADAVAADRKSAAAWYYLGLAQNFLGQTELANGSYSRARELSPKMVGAEVALAELDAKKGDYEKAQRLAETSPQQPLANVLGARAAFASGNLRRASELVQAALDRDPVSLPALELLIDLDARQARIGDAVRRISALISQHPRSAGLQFLLARAYFHSKDLANSATHARKAIALDPKTPDAHALLGRIAYARGSLDEAVLDFQAEVEVTPSSRFSIYMALESLYEKKRSWEDARKFAEMALAADPSSPAAANNLAYLYLEHGGDVNRAVSLAQQAKRADPESPVVADTLGWAFFKSGSPELAITQFKLSLQKFPDNPVYQTHIGMAYLAGGHFEPAEQFLRKAIRSDPELSNAADIRAALDKIASQLRR